MGFKEARIIAAGKIIPLAIKFKIKGLLRFLSHLETQKMLQRACTRAGLDMVYSKGFNPRPKLSLPLPRTVGVESENDVLFLKLKSSPENPEQLLSRELPEGCTVTEIFYPRSSKTPQPVSTVYVLPVREDSVSGLEEKIDQVLSRESIIIHRPHKKGKSKKKEIREFIKSIELKGNKITAECKVTNRGSVRVDELMELLEIETEHLDGAITRTCMEWKNFN
jgi:radical SAM-linked protein